MQWAQKVDKYQGRQEENWENTMVLETGAGRECFENSSLAWVAGVGG